MKNTSRLFLSLLLLAACGTEKKQVEVLEKETGALHNEAMKEVADMNRVARELKAFMISAEMTTEGAIVYNDVLTSMGKAENEMNDWMAGLKNTDEMPVAEAIKYLEGQKEFLEKNLRDLRAAKEAGIKLQGK